MEGVIVREAAAGTVRLADHSRDEDEGTPPWRVR